LFGKPDDLDPRYRLILERKFLNVQSRQKPTLAMRQYITAQTAFSLALLFIITLFEYYLTGMQLFLLSAFVIVSLINSGAILDQRRWIFYLECIRIFIVMIAIAVFYPNNWAFSCIITALILIIWYFRPVQRYYLKLLYTKAGS
jgi:alkylglycerol monooxygenase